VEHIGLGALQIICAERLIRRLDKGYHDRNKSHWPLSDIPQIAVGSSQNLNRLTDFGKPQSREIRG